MIKLSLLSYWARTVFRSKEHNVTINNISAATLKPGFQMRLAIASDYVETLFSVWNTWKQLIGIVSDPSPRISNFSDPAFVIDYMTTSLKHKIYKIKKQSMV